MEHQFTDAELKLTTLEGHDYPLVRNIAEPASESGEFCVLLASMEKFVTMPNYEGVPAVTMVFLPGTFGAAFFAMPILQWDASDSERL